MVTRLGLPRTTTHELLRTLVDRRYLLLVPGQPLRYRLGVRLFQLGSVFAQHLDLAREAQRVAADVAASCEETVHVAVLEGRDVIYIVRVESTHPVRMVSAVGRRLPANCTGVGKMLLSELSPQAIDDLYAPGTQLVTMTSNSIASVSELKAELATIHGRGLSYDEAESSEDVHCVAVRYARRHRRDGGRHEHLGADHPVEQGKPYGVGRPGPRRVRPALREPRLPPVGPRMTSQPGADLPLGRYRPAAQPRPADARGSGRPARRRSTRTPISDAG